MRLYTEATDGSSIEVKESGLVWHHQILDTFGLNFKERSCSGFKCHNFVSFTYI
ncbi:putative alpha,alpha-trehalose-phosphate synthase (UDP-forming) [Helianthus anomalus]